MNALTLYSAADQLASLLDNGIDPETGEISEELGTALAQFEGKGKAVVAYILNQDATAAAIDDAIMKLEQRAQMFRRRADSLREYLRFNMKRTGISSITADDGTFFATLYVGRDKSVEIFDEKQIPPAYLTTPEPPKPRPDKKAIGASLKAGTDVPGARIVAADRLAIK